MQNELILEHVAPRVWARHGSQILASIAAFLLTFGVIGGSVSMLFNPVVQGQSYGVPTSHLMLAANSPA